MGGCRFRGFNFHGIAAFFNGIKLVGINVRGTCLISENHEHYPLSVTELLPYKEFAA